jgi:hypothetical protein
LFFQFSLQVIVEAWNDLRSWSNGDGIDDEFLPSKWKDIKTDLKTAILAFPELNNLEMELATVHQSHSRTSSAAAAEC